MLSESDWKAIRTRVYQLANNQCVICSGRGPKHPVEAHERWGFNEDTQTQYLMRVEALCPDCHTATHFGLAQIRGLSEMAVKRLMYVNGWNEDETEDHINEAFRVWSIRSEIEDWQLDITWLLNYFKLSDESIKIIESMKSGNVKRH